MASVTGDNRSSRDGNRYMQRANLVAVMAKRRATKVRQKGRPTGRRKCPRRQGVVGGDGPDALLKLPKCNGQSRPISVNQRCNFYAVWSGSDGKATGNRKGGKEGDQWGEENVREDRVLVLEDTCPMSC